MSNCCKAPPTDNHTPPPPPSPPTDFTSTIFTTPGADLVRAVTSADCRVLHPTSSMLPLKHCRAEYNGQSSGWSACVAAEAQGDSNRRGDWCVGRRRVVKGCSLLTATPRLTQPFGWRILHRCTEVTSLTARGER